jgi:hypothetical protein
VAKLAPDPRGVAFWRIESYGDLAGLTARPELDDSPVRVVRGGLYADIGEEMPTPMFKTSDG